MSFVVTGFGPIDRPHGDLERCLRDLAATVRARELGPARGWACLLSEKLGEHFADEEALMRARGWSQLARHAESHAHLHLQVSRFERQLAAGDLTAELAWLALQGLPELLRYHAITSDFGFGKFALGVATDPGPGILRRASAGHRRGLVRSLARRR
jgi:hemerythrin